MARGVAILAPDVFLTGEFNLNGQKTALKPVKNEETFATFNHGYNRTVLAQRVRDLTTAIAFAKGTLKPKAIHLVAFDSAGAWALLARALAGDIDHARVDRSGRLRLRSGDVAVRRAAAPRRAEIRRRARLPVAADIRSDRNLRRAARAREDAGDAERDRSPGRSDAGSDDALGARRPHNTSALRVGRDYNHGTWLSVAPAFPSCWSWPSCSWACRRWSSSIPTGCGSANWAISTSSRARCRRRPASPPSSSSSRPA